VPHFGAVKEVTHRPHSQSTWENLSAGTRTGRLPSDTFKTTSKACPHEQANANTMRQTHRRTRR
jgi:hypothetical protein